MSVWVSFVQNLRESLALGFSTELIPASHDLQTRKDTPLFQDLVGEKKIQVVFHDISFLFAVTEGFFLKE